MACSEETAQTAASWNSSKYPEFDICYWHARKKLVLFASSKTAKIEALHKISRQIMQQKLSLLAVSPQKLYKPFSLSL